MIPAKFISLNEMEEALQRIREWAGRLRARAIFPVLAAAAALSAIVGGLERMAFLTGSPAPTVAASVSTSVPAPVQLTYLSSEIAKAEPASAPTPKVALNLNVDHPRITKWVDRLTRSLKGDFKQSLDRMDKYATMITAKLDARQMPRELAYLALIESNFNPTARSRVSAVGLWQFMSATARQFGLKVRGGVDERKNPDKSTDAALTYLSQLYDRFGSWYLAAAAYNSGAGTVSKALNRVVGKSQGTDADFFRILPALPKETQDYVPKLIASARVGSNPAKYGL